MNKSRQLIKSLTISLTSNSLIKQHNKNHLTTRANDIQRSSIPTQGYWKCLLEQNKWLNDPATYPLIVLIFGTFSLGMFTTYDAMHAIYTV